MFDGLKADFAANKNSFGIYAGNGSFYLASLKDGGVMNEIAPEMSEAAKGLDVNVLHSVILDGILGIGDKQLASQSNLKYLKDIGNAIDDAVAKIDSGESQVVFFMNSTKVDQVKDIAMAGEKMPQKSTFFYPKVFTGLVVNKL
jgi:uncharacterized protein (DUF1015 family)